MTSEVWPDLTDEELDDLDVSHAAELDRRVGRAVAQITRLQGERDRLHRLLRRRQISADDRFALRHTLAVARAAIRVADEEGLRDSVELTLARRGIVILTRLVDSDDEPTN